MTLDSKSIKYTLSFYKESTDLSIRSYEEFSPLRYKSHLYNYYGGFYHDKMYEMSKIPSMISDTWRLYSEFVSKLIWNSEFNISEFNTVSPL